jgi:hypothetical protein
MMLTANLHTEKDLTRVLLGANQEIVVTAKVTGDATANTEIWRLCGVKKSRGECIKVSAETVHEIGQKLARICDGLEWFGDVSYHAAFNQHLYIDCLPSGTKRFQIKAYCTTERGKYLLCALLNNRGWPLQVSHGHNTVNYENVFLSEMGAVQGVGKCDFIFFNKIKVPLEECHDTPAVAKRKSPVSSPERRTKRVSAVEGQRFVKLAIESGGTMMTDGEHQSM